MLELKRIVFIFAIWILCVYIAGAQKCEGNHYGYKCRQTCGPNCHDGCNRFTGNCDKGCTSGFYTDWCLKGCEPGCKDGCDQRTGNCNSCHVGRYGISCGATCSENCKNGCSRHTGFCYGCKEGFFGVFCDRPCLASCIDGCDQMEGGCKKCSTGPYGRSCVGQLCLTGSDNCIGCLPGLFGSYCENSCPETCFSECNEEGVCYSCKVGYYGNRCEIPCPKNCAGHCSDEGHCYGCADGWFGKQCDKECPEKCRSEQCGQVSGRCLGYTGTKPLPDKGEQDRAEAKTLDSENKFPLVPILIAVGCVIVILFSLFVLSRLVILYHKKKTRYQQNSETQPMTVEGSGKSGKPGEQLDKGQEQGLLCTKL